ncbi:MAG: exopolysaccharide biosynthesis protein [Marinobacter sp.]|uniref:exopolysaccharide biosynthesis protein n=1 Tax=Marinobacter sp. TaxID=50741 RepID=UPI003F9680D3
MERPTNLEGILARIAKAESEGGGYTSTRAVVNALGRRSYAPLLLLPGLATLSPIGGVPGVPTVISALILLVSMQLLFGRRSFWLPEWLLNRSVSRSKLATSRRWMLRPARFIDFFLRPRLTFMTKGAGVYLIALISIVIALMMPPMELVPFSAIGAGLALTLLGLALLAHDGLVALLGILVTTSTLWLLYSGVTGS